MKEYLDNLISSHSAIIDNQEKHKTFLRDAYNFAEKNSSDNSTWTGAVIVKGDTIVSEGANRFAPGVKKTKERQERPKKYLCQLHCERDAIYNAARKGVSLEGCTMYMPWMPCCACANAIITSGIKALVVHYPKIIRTPEDWLDDIKEAVKMLIEANIRLIVVDEHIGGCKNRFREIEWNP